MKTLLLLLALLSMGFFLMGCTLRIDCNMVSGHAQEKISDTKETDTKVEAEASGLGSLFGL